MQEKYEQAIKSAMQYLNDKKINFTTINEIEQFLTIQGFPVCCAPSADGTLIIYPEQSNLPIHIWKNKSCIK